MNIEKSRRAYKGLAMEGLLTDWYAKNTRSSLAEFKGLARRIAAELPPGGAVLEVAPGPGYLAIEIAKLGISPVAGLDISRSFVRIASENASHEGVDVDFHHGDAAMMPFAGGRFDFIVCRAAFKNFSNPLGALREMYRVLKPGGAGLIIDLRNDASDEAIADEVDRMRLGPVSGMATRMTLRLLKKRAYSREDFARMLAETSFAGADIRASGIGFEIRLVK
jgi:ubiquinone/menaquinone biosynthesis C-methylase UbiE